MAADPRADARPGKIIYLDIVFRERSQDTDMVQSLEASATERNAKFLPIFHV
jgi:hypothetical protein